MATIDGRAVSVGAFEIDQGRIVAIRFVVNPDKLQHVDRATP